jgi:hypothetical protein
VEDFGAAAGWAGAFGWLAALACIGFWMEAICGAPFAVARPPEYRTPEIDPAKNSRIAAAAKQAASSSARVRSREKL